MAESKASLHTRLQKKKKKKNIITQIKSLSIGCDPIIITSKQVKETK